MVAVLGGEHRALHVVRHLVQAHRDAVLLADPAHLGPVAVEDPGGGGGRALVRLGHVGDGVAHTHQRHEAQHRGQSAQQQQPAPAHVRQSSHAPMVAHGTCGPCEPLVTASAQPVPSRRCRTRFAGAVPGVPPVQLRTRWFHRQPAHTSTSCTENSGYAAVQRLQLRGVAGAAAVVADRLAVDPRHLAQRLPAADRAGPLGQHAVRLRGPDEEDAGVADVVRRGGREQPAAVERAQQGATGEGVVDDVAAHPADATRAPQAVHPVFVIGLRSACTADGPDVLSCSAMYRTDTSHRQV